MIKRGSKAFDVLTVIAAAVFGWIMLTAALPLGIVFRYKLLIPLIIVLGVTFVAFRLDGWLGKLFGIIAVVLFFTLSLNGLWASGESEPYLMGGLLPAADANDYYLNALRVLEGLPINSWRPLFVAFLALILAVCHNSLQAAVAVMVIICALCCYLAGREVQKTHGTLAAAFFVTCIFFFYRTLTGKTMTENLGLALGLVGFALIWRSAALRQDKAALWGLLALSLALNARSGAFFILGTLLLWGCWFFRKGGLISFSFLLRGVAAILGGFLINWLVSTLLGNASAVMGNFSYTLYGLVVGGKGWGQIGLDHPDALMLSEPEKSRLIYQYALQAFQANPYNTLIGIIQSIKMFFATGYYGAFCYFSEFLHQESLQSTLCQAAMFFLWGLGLVISGIQIAYKRWRTPYGLMIIAATLGIVLSIPFAPPLDASRMRAYAATIPFFVILAVLGLAWIVRKIRAGFLIAVPGRVNSGGMLPVTLGILVGMMLFPALFCHFFVHPLELPDSPCKNANWSSVYLRYSTGTYVRLTTSPYNWVPVLNIGDFGRLLHNSPYFPVFDALGTLDPNTYLLRTINLKDNSYVFLITDGSLLPAQDGIVQVCGKWNNEPLASAWKLLYARSIQPVSINPSTP